VDIADNLPPLRADRQRILQILFNIISNACKFTRHGSIKLRAYQTGDDVVISVQDTGPGIAPQDHSLVYEAFKQTDTGLRHAGGTGLGMPISKNLAEAHGGRLWLESELGKGSTFFVSLPVKSERLVPVFSASQEV
jgi:signal transduction histidine kinase